MDSKKQDNKGDIQADKTKGKTRRGMLKSIAAGSTIVAGDQWAKPVINSVSVPVHARFTTPTGSPTISPFPTAQTVSPSPTNTFSPFPSDV